MGLSLPFIPPRDSGEGGPRVCAVGGASESKLILQSKRSADTRAPSTILRCYAASDGPPPPLARGRMSGIVLAMRLRIRAMPKPRTLCLHKSEGRRSAGRRNVLEPHPAAARCAPARSPVGAPPRRSPRLLPLGSTPGRASWNYRVQTGGPSPAPVQRAPRRPVVVPAGTMPGAARERFARPRAGTALAAAIGSHPECTLHERAACM
jgi:hypothetical protein